LDNAAEIDYPNQDRPSDISGKIRLFAAGLTLQLQGYPVSTTSDPWWIPARREAYLALMKVTCLFL
jgi:hypothetical protein